MNLQEAVETPRINNLKGMKVYLEDGIPDETASTLVRIGHRVIREDPPANQVGSGQAIYFNRLQNVLLGASNRRKDGYAMGY
jgi:gamma-glutamyltranspeptidase / glutathione hydrolase